MSARPDPPRPPEYEHPVYWFVLLMRAIDAGDRDAAATAQRELRRLGVTVTYRRRLRRGVGHAR